MIRFAFAKYKEKVVAILMLCFLFAAPARLHECTHIVRYMTSRTL